MNDEIETIDKLLEFLPEFIEKEYPKGNHERGMATVNIALFLNQAKVRLLTNQAHSLK